MPELPSNRSLPVLGLWLRGALAVAAFSLPLAAQTACPNDPKLMIEQLNRTRAEGAVCGGRGTFPPAPAVVWNERLAVMARAQAEWLVAVDDLLHHGPQGQTLTERALNAGYRFAKVGENLAQGQRTLQGALHGWTVSETHCATLYAAAYTEAAIICLPARDGRPLWVMEMGRPKQPFPLQSALPPRSP